MTDFLDDMLEEVDATFGSEAVCTPAGGGPSFSFTVIPSQDDDIASIGQTRIKSDSTLLECRVAEYPAPANGDAIQYGGDSYKIKFFRRIDDHRLLWLLECYPA